MTHGPCTTTASPRTSTIGCAMYVLPSDAVGYAERVDEAALSFVGDIAQDPHPVLWRDVSCPY